MKKKKILILTLGVGNALGKQDPEHRITVYKEMVEKLKEYVEKEVYPYEKTTYVVQKLNGKADEVESEYVADIQVRDFQPDMIYIVGTVKSGWSMFYRKFTQNNHDIDQNTKWEDVKALFEIEQKNGKDTTASRLRELEKVIQDIYNQKLRFQSDRHIEIRVALIRYGINQEELLENYQKISEIEQYLDIDAENEIAFDITHSFRSLPIYNLTILNYLRQISKYQINISHIYYGNFDIKYENDKKAPLVDLNEMVDVLNLTSAVSEFKNTGNAVSLIRLLPEADHELRQILEKFDLATQINDRRQVFSTLAELEGILNRNETEGTKYADVRKMLKSVLSEEPLNLFHLNGYEDTGKAQLILTQWYRKQNRYGIALATAMETLRSMLVPFYLQICNQINKDSEDYRELCENEEKRKNAVQRLERKAIWYEETGGTFGREMEIKEFLLDLEKERKAMVELRNMFAHNLDNEKERNEDVKNQVNAFIDKLAILQGYIEQNPTEFAHVYGYENAKRENKKLDDEYIRVYVSDKYGKLKSDEKERLRRSSQHKYTVYKVAEKLTQYNKNSNSASILKKGCTLCEYLKVWFENNVCIILDKSMRDKVWITYAALLYDEGFENVFARDPGTGMVEKVSKLLFDYSYQKPEVDIAWLLNEEPEKL